MGLSIIINLFLESFNMCKNTIIKKSPNRIKYMSELADTKPKKFVKEWKKRQISWVQLHEKKCKGKISDFRIFDLLEEVMQELSLYGPAAEKLVAIETEKEIKDILCKMFSKSSGKYNLYRLSNSDSNYKKMKVFNYKLPR